MSFTRIYKGSNAELIAHKKTRVITIILLAFAGMIYGLDTSSRGDYVNPSGLGIFIYFAALVPLFSCCTAVFKDMHDIPTADVQMSMPLSSEERYFSRLLTICRIWLIPFFISAAGAFLLSAMFAGTHYTYHSSDITDYSRTYHPEVLMVYNLQMLLWFLAAVLFIIAVTVVCQCCIGAKAESKYLPVMMMTALSIFAPAMYFFVTDNFAEVQTSGEPFIYSLWTFSALFVEFDSVRDMILMLVNCLISLGVIYCGRFICRKRDARTVGKPIVFPLFFEVIMFVTLTLFFVLFHTDWDSFVVMFLSWLGSIILRIVVSRKNFSFAKIGIWTGMFIGYYIVFLLFMYIAFLTGGFGAITKTPVSSEYVGVGANVDIRIVECRTVYWYDGYDNEELINSGFQLALTGGNTEKLQSFVDNISRTASRQPRIKGLFSRQMFGTHMPSGIYHCTVNVRVTDKYYDDGSYRYGNTIYSAEFNMTRSDAENLAKLAQELDMGY
ncbi:MAG: hypothetical protein ACI4J0_09285 [Huintestinicola sp.]|uniref:hypothetical protein n=1 Tax=Huintestinicola sp. TaxID=2981661 RepID=UPI003EFCBF85